MKDRSHSQPAPHEKTVFTSQYGTVRVYVLRHINGCPSTDPNERKCPCPKHIYFNRRNGKDGRLSAKTPSYTEACEQAQEILKGLNPEIAEARARKAQPAPSDITVEEAMEKYFAHKRSLNASEDYLHRSIGIVFRRRTAQATGKAKNLTLLEFLERRFPHRPAVMREITPDLADEWAATWRCNDLTTRTWRAVARGFFSWAVDRGYLQRKPFSGRYAVAAGNRCGHFPEEQFQKLLATLPFSGPERGPSPKNYAARLRAFCELGRFAGMAIADIVLFNPRESVRPDNVLVYRRHKTRRKVNLVTKIALPPEVAVRLRSIPPEDGSSPEQPFLFAGTRMQQNKRVWRDRFRKLCFKAGILEVTTEIGKVRWPHPHMLRDTFAISALEEGIGLREVSVMCGHKSTVMTERSYARWTEIQDQRSLEAQRAVLERRSARVEVVSEDGRQPGAIGPPLVH
jgi:integrase